MNFGETSDILLWANSTTGQRVIERYRVRFRCNCPEGSLHPEHLTDISEPREGFSKAGLLFWAAATWILQSDEHTLGQPVMTLYSKTRKEIIPKASGDGALYVWFERDETVTESKLEASQ